jgi:hypothetical protein
MRTSTKRVVVGLDNGGKVNNATVLESSGRFLVDGLIESLASYGKVRILRSRLWRGHLMTSWHLPARQRAQSSRLGWIRQDQPVPRASSRRGAQQTSPILHGGVSMSAAR